MPQLIASKEITRRRKHEERPQRSKYNLMITNEYKRIKKTLIKLNFTENGAINSAVHSKDNISSQETVVLEGLKTTKVLVSSSFHSCMWE